MMPYFDASRDEFSVSLSILPPLLIWIVDLPTEPERLDILKTLLSSEKLDESVSLEELAAKTNLYSGSDLKNVCISAAMQAVHDALRAESPTHDLLDEYGALTVQPEEEEGDAATTRVLQQRHFDHALNEIASSANEQQESLERLRKWNRMFGDDHSTRSTAKVKFGF